MFWEIAQVQKRMTLRIFQLLAVIFGVFARPTPQEDFVQKCMIAQNANCEDLMYIMKSWALVQHQETICSLTLFQYDKAFVRTCGEWTKDCDWICNEAFDSESEYCQECLTKKSEKCVDNTALVSSQD